MGIFLLVPFFLIRFGLLSRLSKEAVKRAAAFAPLVGWERAAYWVYQLSNAGIFLCLAFLRIGPVPSGSFFAGLALYLAGLALLAVSVVNFAAPEKNGINRNGIYRVSRNPMYVAYFVFFLGCALLTRSPVLLVLILVFQTAAHWIILSEERWCAEKFGEEYVQYKNEVRRYL